MNYKLLKPSRENYSIEAGFSSIVVNQVLLEKASDHTTNPIKLLINLNLHKNYWVFITNYVKSYVSPETLSFVCN